MSSQSRLVRLFISSTFSDMVHERRILHEQVFPDLTRLCASRGARFQAVDLRWGVNEESQLDHKTMELCLGEIERCQRLSPKPNFLVLLGDRYGWEPVPARILSEEFEELRTLATASQAELLDQWYVRDDNAVPAQHVLKRRGEDFDEYHEWAPEEAKLLQAVRELVEKAGLEGDARDKYFQSATHQEIVRGALSLPTVPENTVDPGEHVLACFRTIEGLPQEPNTFFDDRSAELDALQAELRTRLAETDNSTDNVYRYNAAWQPADQDDIALEDESAFAQRVLEHFTRVITAQLDGLEGMSTLEAEQQAQQQFRDDRCRHFAGREETLAAIDTYLNSDDSRVMALIGSGGSGKSALMAQVTKRVGQRPGLLVYRFIGATPASTLIDSVLHSITEELASALQDAESIPTQREELVKYLAGLLGRATPEQPITIVVDALDQLTEADARQLDWLPEELPANAKFIVSALPELEAALDKTQQIGVPLLSDEAGEVILKAWLSDVGRTLQPEQHAAVIKSFAANGLPLYLKLAFEQARHWGSTESPSGLPADIDGMIGAMLDALEKDHTPSRILESAEVVTAPLVQTALGLLQAARYGLAENELLDVVSADEAFFNAYKQTTHHELSEARLPIAVWSRLYLDLAAYLVEREAQDVVVLGFFHRQVGDVIGQRYGSESDGQRSHAQLATYFGGQENFLDDARKQPNGRRLGELPHQQLHSAQWQALEATLTDFDLLMATCQAGMQAQLVSDYHEAWQRLQTAGYTELRLWEAFLRERAHILARGNEEWGAHKILLQLAVEHADDSPVTKAAEAWLEGGNCDWLWLRSAWREKEASPCPCLRVFEGHKGRVRGTLLFDDNKAVSWGKSTLRIWDLRTGECEAVLQGHSSLIWGASSLSDGRVLSWSWDNTLRIWDLTTGECTAVLEGHTDKVIGATVLDTEQILSWSRDGTLRLWDGKGTVIRVLEGHTDEVCGAQLLKGGRIISWSEDGTVRVWDQDTGEVIASVEGRTMVIPDGRVLVVRSGMEKWNDRCGSLEKVNNQCAVWDPDTEKFQSTFDGYNKAFVDAIGCATSLPNGRILSWGAACLHVWNPNNGEQEALLSGHSNLVQGGMGLPDGRVISWSDDSTLRIWDLESAECEAVLQGHTDEIGGVKILPDGRLLSWSWDNTLRIWDMETAECQSVLEGHDDEVEGAICLEDGRVLSWSSDQTLRLWNTDFADHQGERHLDNVRGITVLPNERVASWAGENHGGRFRQSCDNALRLWDVSTGECVAVLKGHSDDICNVIVLPNGRLLSWSMDGSLRLWDTDSGDPIATLGDPWKLSRTKKDIVFASEDVQHKGMVCGVTIVSDERLLSWAGQLPGSHPEFAQLDHTLRLWDADNGDPIATLEGHTDQVNGAVVHDGAYILSWSDDGTLRLWDGKTGAALQVIPVPICFQPDPEDDSEYTKKVSGAQILEDGSVLSWSLDGTFRVWSERTGWSEYTGADVSSVGGNDPIISMNGQTFGERYFGEPALFFGRHLKVEGVRQGGTYANPFDKQDTGPLSRMPRLFFETGLTVYWNGDGTWHAPALLQSGTLVVHCDKDLALLHLYYGNRRVTLEGACEAVPAAGDNTGLKLFD